MRDQWGVIIGFAENCDIDVDPVAINNIAATLRSDPAVVAELRYQYSFAVSAVLNIGGQMANLEHAFTALGAAPGTAADMSAG